MSTNTARTPHPFRVALATVSAVLVAGVVALFLAVGWASDNTPTPILPCLTEDSAGPCYWDAETMGNGVGDSFTVDEHGNVEYWDSEPESEPYVPMDEESAWLWQVQDGTATD